MSWNSFNPENQTLDNDTLTTDGNDTISNATSGLPYDDSPANVKQAILIFRLVLLGLGLIGNALLIFVYIKCSNIITNRLGVYVINICVALIIDLFDGVFWSLKQFGYDHENPEYGFPKIACQLAGIPQMGLPTTSLFFTLMLFDRFFATCLARCYKSCYGSKANAIVLSVLLWLGSFFPHFHNHISRPVVPIRRTAHNSPFLNLIYRAICDQTSVGNSTAGEAQNGSGQRREPGFHRTASQSPVLYADNCHNSPLV